MQSPMHKMSGRYLLPEYSGCILLLDDDELYSAGQITRKFLKRKKDKQNQKKPTKYDRMRNSIWHFGSRNNLTSNPDNAARDADGKILYNQKNKIRLIPRETYPRLYGKSWKNLLTIEDVERGDAWIRENKTKEVNGINENQAVESQTKPKDKMENNHFKETPLADSGSNKVKLSNLKQTPENQSRHRQSRYQTFGSRLRLRFRRFVLFFSLRKVHMRLSIGAFLGLVFFVSMGTARYGLNTVREVYAERGPIAALKMSFLNKENGLEEYFNLGWYYFQANENERSLAIMDKILEKETQLPHSFLGKVYCAKGSILTFSHDFENATLCLEKSELYYQKSNNLEGFHRALLEKIRLLWKMSKPFEALDNLNYLSKHIEPSLEIPQLYSHIYFDLGQYSDSIRHSKIMMESEYIVDRIEAYRMIGLCYLFQNNLELGAHYTYEAEALAVEISDPVINYYLLLNKIHLGNYLGTDTAVLFDTLHQWAESRSDYYILNHLSRMNQ